MLQITNQTYFDEVAAEAAQLGIRDRLDAKLEYLKCYGWKHNADGNEVSNDGSADDSYRVELGYDFARLSFGILWMQRGEDGEFSLAMNGGLIFDGPSSPCNGSAPQFCVNLGERGDGKGDWGVHT